MRTIEPGEPLWEIRALRIENEILTSRFERMRSAFEKKLKEKMVLHKHYRQALSEARSINETLKKRNELIRMLRNSVLNKEELVKIEKSIKELNE